MQTGGPTASPRGREGGRRRRRRPPLLRCRRRVRHRRHPVHRAGRGVAALRAAEQGVLDPNLRVVRVASRCPRNGTPRVLECYPLRRTLSVARSETKGFSKHKWNPRVGDRPVPWPNTFWLCCPDLIASVGRLGKHCGLIKKATRGSGFPTPSPTRRARERARTIRRATRSVRVAPVAPVVAGRPNARREGYDAILEKCGVGDCASPSRSSACTCTTRTSSRRGTTSWASGARTRWTKRSFRNTFCKSEQRGEFVATNRRKALVYVAMNR